MSLDPTDIMRRFIFHQKIYQDSVYGLILTNLIHAIDVLNIMQ